MDQYIIYYNGMDFYIKEFDKYDVDISYGNTMLVLNKEELTILYQNIKEFIKEE